MLWKSDQEDGNYINPVLYADYSDPDVIRVGDTFYMTASSFNYTPGLPILVSKDLVNWELANYALDRIDFPEYDRPQHARGVWAPAMRYHDGEFFIYYGMPDEGIFMVKTKNPLGKWDKPVTVLEGRGLIDPCPFWDDDGRTYLIHAYAKSRTGFNSVLGIFEMNAEGTKAVSDDRIFFDGTRTQITIEGPKVYKKNGRYYIFAPAGGVKYGWQTVLRSENIDGPYEERIVMHQGNTDINGPHQGALVDTEYGDEWFLHFQDRGMYGRIVHLQPVRWKDGWPVIGTNEDENGCGEPVWSWKKPRVRCESKAKYLEACDDFGGVSPGLGWQWLGNGRDDFYEMAPDGLRLNCLYLSQKEPAVLWEQANVLTQKLLCPKFMAETCMNISNLRADNRAGLVMMGGTYAYLGVSRSKNGLNIILGEGCDTDEKITAAEHLPENTNKIRLRGTMTDCFRLSYSFDGAQYKNVDFAFRPTDHTWVGAKLGLFAVADNAKAARGGVVFEYFKVTKISGGGF